MVDKLKLHVVLGPLFSPALEPYFADHFEITDIAPDVALVDINTLSTYSDDPKVKLIVVGSIYDTPQDMLKLLELGAYAYAGVSVTLDILLDIIKLVHAGNAIWPIEVLESLRQSPFRPEAITLPKPAIMIALSPRFSPREKAIFKLLAEGLPNKNIARETNIAEATVKVHVKAILRKLRVQNRTQAAMWLANNPLTLESNDAEALPCRIAGNPLADEEVANRSEGVSSSLVHTLGRGEEGMEFSGY